MSSPDMFEQSIVIVPTSDLIILGLTGSGKSTLAKRLSNVTGAKILEVGQAVMQDASTCRKCTSPPQHADHMIRSGNWLRFVQRVVKIAQDYGTPSIVVGPRHPFEVHFLAKSLRTPLIVGLELPDWMRWMRYEMPSDVRNVVKDKVKFHERDATERRWGVRYSLYMSDVLLDATRKPAEIEREALYAWRCHCIPLGRTVSWTTKKQPLVSPEEKLLSDPNAFKHLVVLETELYRTKRIMETFNRTMRVKSK